jgi:threonine dehydratase
MVIDWIPPAAIFRARHGLEGIAIKTPLVRLALDEAPCEIYLKLENLQPTGSFKLRGAANAMAMLGPDELEGGVYTISAGNMGLGVAWNARRLNVPCQVVVPDHAPRTKVDAITRLGAEVVPVPFEEWWMAMENHDYPGLEGTFIHPAVDPAVIAANGTIGLEILEDLPGVDAVVAPFGGGGLCCGIASAFQTQKPEVRVFACEVETAAPFDAALEAGEPVDVEYTPSFVDGIGGQRVLEEMWPLSQELLDDSLVVPLLEVAVAVRLLADCSHVIAEGAGAVSLAAALSGRAGDGKVVCVVSGGNIDADKLAEILRGGMP